MTSAAEVRLGRALELLPRLAAERLEPFDFLFIDADKASIRSTLPVPPGNLSTNGRRMDDSATRAPGQHTAGPALATPMRTASHHARQQHRPGCRASAVVAPGDDCCQKRQVHAGVFGRCCVVLWVATQWLAPTKATAAELSIATPAACAVADELRFRTERALGQPIESAAAVRCTVHIARSAGGYAARMEVESLGSGKPSRLRSFTAPTCEKLTETLALAVLLAIGARPGEVSAVPSAAAPPSPGASDAGGAAKASTSPQGVDTPTAYPGQTRDGVPGPGFGASAGLLADAGTLPGAGLGVSLGAALDWQGVELRLLGTYLPAREASISTSSGSGSAEIGLVAGSVAGCLPRRLSSSGLELGPCVGAELGWLSGSGTGLDVARSGGGLWSAARLDAVARWVLGNGIGLDFLLSALVPLQRHEFEVSGPGLVFQPSAVVGRAGVGLSLELGSTDSSL
jgi:hypothetical protein